MRRRPTWPTTRPQGARLPRRHEIVARAVREAEAAGKDLPDLSLAQLRAFSALIGRDVHAGSRRKARLRHASTSAERHPRPSARRSRGRERRSPANRPARRSPPPSPRRSSRSSASPVPTGDRHLAAAVDALRELLAVRAAVAGAEGLSSLSSCSVSSASRSAETALRMRLGLMLRVAFCHGRVGWLS
jgi:hypothetical protein